MVNATPGLVTAASFNSCNCFVKLVNDASTPAAAPSASIAMLYSALTGTLCGGALGWLFCAAKYAAAPTAISRAAMPSATVRPLFERVVATPGVIAMGHSPLQ